MIDRKDGHVYDIAHIPCSCATFPGLCIFSLSSSLLCPQTTYTVLVFVLSLTLSLSHVLSGVVFVVRFLCDLWLAGWFYGYGVARLAVWMFCVRVTCTRACGLYTVVWFCWLVSPCLKGVRILRRNLIPSSLLCNTHRLSFLTIWTVSSYIIIITIIAPLHAKSTYLYCVFLCYCMVVKYNEIRAKERMNKYDHSNQLVHRISCY